MIDIKKLGQDLKIPRLRRVGEEKLSELCLGQLADVIGFV
jgi:hypothetical protein